LIDADALIDTLVNVSNNDQFRFFPIWIEKQIDAQPTVSILKEQETKNFNEKSSTPIAKKGLCKQEHKAEGRKEDMSRVVVVEKNKDGKIELTKDELQKMLDDAYNQGYLDGKATKLDTITYPSYPWTVTTEITSNGTDVSSGV
jgi:hypothetical protein